MADRAFDMGMRGYTGGGNIHRLPPREECSLAEFESALQTLRQSVPAIKQRIVVAVAACILANDHVTVREAELLRAICDTLDSPLPPLFATETEGSLIRKPRFKRTPSSASRLVELVAGDAAFTFGRTRSPADNRKSARSTSEATAHSRQLSVSSQNRLVDRVLRIKHGRRMRGQDCVRYALESTQL